MTITITGSSGFVGQNLSAFLKENNHAIKGLSLRENNWAERLDKNSDAIIHLAGKAHDTENTSSSEEYFTVNRDLSKALFQEFLKGSAKDFFYFSSVKAAADTVDGILDENHQPNPVTPYGKSKIEAENYLLSQARPKGKRLFIIRPCMIHGPGNKGNLNLLYKVVEKNIPWPLTAFENKRSFLGIDNLNYLIHEMLNHKDLPSGIYNFADDEALSTNDLIKTVNKALDKKPKLWHISKILIEKTARAGDRLKLPLNSERLKKLTESYVVSNQKIKTALGIDKLPYTAEQGLIKTIQSFKQNK